MTYTTNYIYIYTNDISIVMTILLHYGYMNVNKDITSTN